MEAAVRARVTAPVGAVVGGGSLWTASCGCIRCDSRLVSHSDMGRTETRANAQRTFKIRCPDGWEHGSDAAPESGEGLPDCLVRCNVASVIFFEVHVNDAH